jgi:hypothetical protein
MLNDQQFSQPSLPGIAAARPSTFARQSAGTVPNVGVGGSIPDTFSDDEPHQLRMFMKPHEIMDQYQSLPGDRKSRYRMVDSGGGWKQREETGEFETNGQLWKRKQKESLTRGMNRSRGKPGLMESVEDSGVKSPVHLGTSDSVYAPNGQRTWAADASDGRPAVVGGHHRIAAAAAVRPDEEIPVMHHADIWAARGEQRPLIDNYGRATGSQYVRKPWEKAYRRKYS